MDIKELNKTLMERVKQGDMKARDKIIMLNLPFVTHIFTTKFKNTKAQDREDFLECGVLGLIKAVDTFKIDKGFEFSTYAARCIENEILMKIRLEKKHKGIISLDEPVNCKAEEKYTKIDSVKDPEDINETIDDLMDIKSIKTLVKCKLPENQAKVIESRYFSGDIKTQAEVVQETGFSQSYVSRLEKKGIEYLRTHLIKAENS